MDTTVEQELKQISESPDRDMDGTEFQAAFPAIAQALLEYSEEPIVPGDLFSIFQGHLFVDGWDGFTGVWDEKEGGFIDGAEDLMDAYYSR